MLKFKKIFLGILILMMFVVSGCSKETQTTTSSSDIPTTTINEVIPEEVQMICGISPRIINVGDDDLELMCMCYINNEVVDADIIWTSSDENIATITPNEDDETNAKLKAINAGTVTINVFSALNIEICDSYTFTVFNDNKDLLTVAEIKEELDELIPNEVSKNINLPKTLRDGSVRLTWKTSNADLFTTTGLYNRDEEDAEVTISCDIKCGRTTQTWEKTVTIIGIKNHGFKNISTRPITFVYLYDNKFLSFNNGDLNKIDIINYSFALIKNGKIDCSTLRNYKNVMRARSEGVRVVVSIGGWGADGWSDAVVNETTRQTFVASIIEAIQKYHFDGVDLDWEYPTQATSQNIGSNGAVDKDNYTELVKLLRTEMDKINENLILSNAVSNTGTGYYNIPELDKYLDYWHIMTYEMASSERTSFDSNLFTSTNASSSASGSIKKYINAGATKSKLVLGCAFYAYLYIVSAEEYSMSLSKNGLKMTSTEPAKQVAYSEVVKYIKPENCKWDDTAKAAWMFFKNSDGTYTFITYDSYNAVTAKAEYVKTEGLAGLMAWEYCEDNQSQLLSAMYLGLR